MWSSPCSGRVGPYVLRSSLRSLGCSAMQRPGRPSPFNGAACSTPRRCRYRCLACSINSIRVRPPNGISRLLNGQLPSTCNQPHVAGVSAPGTFGRCAGAGYPPAATARHGSTRHGSAGCLESLPAFLALSSQSPSGPAGGAPDGYGLGRGATGPRGTIPAARARAEPARSTGHRLFISGP